MNTTNEQENLSQDTDERAVGEILRDTLEQIAESVKQSNILLEKLSENTELHTECLKKLGKCVQSLDEFIELGNEALKT